MFKKLFTPITVRGLELKNRVILPAMGTKFVNKDRTVSQQLIDYHVTRAKGGAGLNIAEVASVHTPSAPRKFLSISDDKYIPGLKQLTGAIHSAGGKAGVQLWQGSLAVGMDQAAMILLASDMPVSAEITLPGVTIEQIKEVVDCYGKAAKRAAEAGFDCVEVHMAHNYLPHSFLSGGINHRQDEYGGSFENRARFPLEVLRAVRKNLPDDMPVFMRIDAHDDYLDNGLTIEEIIQFCLLAKDAGVDVLDISRGNIITAGIKYEVPPIDIPRAFNIENAARIRRETGMLTMGVGRINTPELAEDLLEKEKIDLVGIGRAQLADPDFVTKAKEGRSDTINRCVGCNQGCYDGFENVDSPHISCLRNPLLGREGEDVLSPAAKPETVLIAGGGIAGMMAALALKRRGHKPILCESGDRLGGQFILAGKAPRKKEMEEAIGHMAQMVEKAGVDIRLNTPVTASFIREMAPHTVINAIGGVPVIPPIPGSTGGKVVSSHDLLAGKVSIAGNVVVIGGGMVGMEAAEYLVEKGSKVTVLELLPNFCADMGTTRKTCVTESIYASGITPITNAKVFEITPDRVVAKQEGKDIDVPYDWVVLAVGSKSRDAGELEAACRESGSAYIAIGDANAARRAIDATREAMWAAGRFDDPEFRRDILRKPRVVFVTGGSGTMGIETIKQLLSRTPRYKVRALVRHSDKNAALMKKMTHPMLEVVWGDMTDDAAIQRCVEGADAVLHIGAMVSPMADKYPLETLKTNIGSTVSIINAIKKQPNCDDIRFAYVGTVAMTGSRLEPVHWGRCGDPLNPSIHDYYALSKVFSEMTLFESGLKHWVSIRQTGQHPSNEAAADEPIIFHQPPNNVLEWSTSIESGICMANICEDWVDESFWRRSYNLSSGAAYRFTTWEFANLLMGPMGINFKDVYDPRQMALFNFHGQWYTDTDELDKQLHFRVIEPSAYWAGVKGEIEALMANPMIRAMMPTAEQLRQKNALIGHKEMGFHWMFETNQEDWIRAFFGSREKQAAIKSFEEGYELVRPSEEPAYLDHGYDESKALSKLTTEDIQKAAAFRGGKLLSGWGGDIYAPLEWQCADGHTFTLSLNAVLQGGHWCPECLRSEWAYADMAAKNPFYAQVWLPTHGNGDNYRIPMKFSAFDIWKEKTGGSN
ncbi:MAG: FAD-dependent oxidoreductase [Treponema sp.]|jgi:2,4-dienoyl-CoA reductase-like NADH-dependent reductase (Old Yellow Enzyme family)/nucleoside-diphosphate-sugar epimerase|nr:FAD-dependent oxidoreductase [Treponema sp.]